MLSMNLVLKGFDSHLLASCASDHLGSHLSEAEIDLQARSLDSCSDASHRVSPDLAGKGVAACHGHAMRPACAFPHQR